MLLKIMIIQCKNCLRKFIVKTKDIPSEGRMVKCGYCSSDWLQMPSENPIKTEVPNVNENLSVDSIKASDGKTYRFLGSQWAQVLPSGKAGLFAKKKIGKELDKLTGRKPNKITKRKIKKTKDFNPSGDNDAEKKLPDIYRQKKSLGFFGYIFLIIIVGFSLVGVLKTFENDLINNFPEITYIYELLDIQLEYFSETVKNMITIINDLTNSY